MPDLPDLAADDGQLPREIDELIEAVGALRKQDRSALEPILSRLVQTTQRRRAILLAVQDSLAQLRLDMKYLMFDLEATRRERDEYRRQLD